MASAKIASLLICLVILLSGCATYRGMPSHGGGKRFDEEQRVVAAAIRHAVKQMDLTELEGKLIALEFGNLETSGTGQPFYPGLGGLNMSAGFADTDSFIRRASKGFALIPGETASTQNNYNSNDGNDRWDARVTGSYQFNPSLRTNNNITREDLDYLKKVVEMQLRHNGLRVVAPAKAETLLIILVDVLGTNLSRTDYGLAYQDELGASCEITYYALNPKNQIVISPSKSAGAWGLYKETNVRFTPFREKTRSIEAIESPILQTIRDIAGSNGTQSAEIDMNTQTKLDSQLNSLYQIAIIQLEANNWKAASESISLIRTIDPKYQNLPELEQALEQNYQK